MMKHRHGNYDCNKNENEKKNPFLKNKTKEKQQTNNNNNKTKQLVRKISHTIKSMLQLRYTLNYWWLNIKQEQENRINKCNIKY